MIKNAHPLTEAQLRDLARELAVQLARIERRLALSEDDPLDALGGHDGPADDRTDERRELRSQRAQLTAAIGRISAGTYGECLSCGAPLSYGRLIMQPEVGLCTGCAMVPG